MTGPADNEMVKDAAAGGLNPKQAAFVREYLVDKNATQAAIRAGYSPKSAYSMAEALLKKHEIRAAVQAGLSDLAAKAGLTAEMVLRERRRLAFFDPRKLLDSEGNPKPLHELDDDTAAAIAGVEVVQMSVSGDMPAVQSVVKKYKFATKDNSLAALEKYFGLNEKPIRLAAPKVETAQDCAQAQMVLLESVAAGDMLPSQAQAIGALIDARRRAIETDDIVARLAALEAVVQSRRAS